MDTTFKSSAICTMGACRFDTEFGSLEVVPLVFSFLSVDESSADDGGGAFKNSSAGNSISHVPDRNCAPEQQQQ